MLARATAKDTTHLTIDAVDALTLVGAGPRDGIVFPDVGRCDLVCNHAPPDAPKVGSGEGDRRSGGNKKKQREVFDSYNNESTLNTKHKTLKKTKASLRSLLSVCSSQDDGA